jgi:hypothetical protein
MGALASWIRVLSRPESTDRVRRWRRGFREGAFRGPSVAARAVGGCVGGALRVLPGLRAGFPGPACLSVCGVGWSPPEPSTASPARLRAFFHALRARLACLRARLASRFASFSHLRARLSSSLAIRTRCLATSACSRARSRGSADASSRGAAGASWLSLPVFCMSETKSEVSDLCSFTQAGAGCQRRGKLSTEVVHNYVEKRVMEGERGNCSKGLHQGAQVLASCSIMRATARR